MLPIFGYAALNEIGEKAIVAANPAGNSAGPMLAQEVGGDILYALVAGVTIATILAVLAGMAIAVSGAVAHDLYTNVIKKGDVDERGQLITGRLAGAVSAAIAILLAFGAKDLNIANVANIAFAIAASTTMPTLLLTIYWRRFNQIGALCGAWSAACALARARASSGRTCSARTTRSSLWRSRRSSRCPRASCSRSGDDDRRRPRRLDRDALRRVRARAFAPDEATAGARALHPQARGRAGGGGVTVLDRDADRERFLRDHAASLYVELADGGPLRVEALLERAAEQVPGSCRAATSWPPSASGRWRTRTGWRSRRACCSRTCSPTPRPARTSCGRCFARRRRRSSDSTTSAPPASPTSARRTCAREGRAGVLELRNPRHLNAEDDTTLPATEVAVDLALLDPEIESGSSAAAWSTTRATRGGGSSAPASTSRTSTAAAISFAFYVVRDLGYVNKLYRGLGDVHRPAEPEQTTRSYGSRRSRRTRSAAPASCCTWSTT